MAGLLVQLSLLVPYKLSELTNNVALKMGDQSCGHDCELGVNVPNAAGHSSDSFRCHQQRIMSCRALSKAQYVQNVYMTP